jgi:hypothetical protein
MSPELRLETLLLSLFTSDELARWLRHYVDAKLVDELPAGAVSPMQLVHQTILALQRRGLVNESFFQGLIAERPGRSADIQLTAKWCLDQPRHFLLSPYQVCVNRGNRFDFDRHPLPASCIGVSLHSHVDNWDLEHDVDAAVFDAGACGSFLEMLDTLYLHYLEDRFAPLTYGQEWVLARSDDWRALVPWDWLVDARAGQWSRVSPHWVAQKSLSDLGVAPGANLEVVDLGRVSTQAQRCIYGFAADSETLRLAFRENPKVRHVLITNSVVADTLPGAVAPGAFRYEEIYFGFEWELLPSSGAWMQAREFREDDLGPWRAALGAWRQKAQR